RTDVLEHAQRLSVAEPDGLLLDLLGSVDGASAQASLEEVDVLAAERRVRRAQERIQIGACPAEPRKAEQAEQRLAVRRLVEPDVRLERVRNAQRPERRLERRLPGLE